MSADLAGAIQSIVGTDRGAGVGVLYDGEVAFEGGFGLANVEQRLPFTAQSRFRCCSLTKQFTATLIVAAAHEGRLKLNDHPRRHLPAVPLPDGGLTLRHLLTNQSGIPDYWCLAMLTGAGAHSRFRDADATRLLAAIDWLDFRCGTRFAYSNTNFLILGKVLEQVYGEPLGAVFERRILAPLGMADSLLAPVTSVPLPDGTAGYEHDAAGRRVPAFVDIEWGGDAALVSTVGDLLRWAAVHDGRGPAALVEAVRRIAAPGTYTNGSSAPYRAGIRRTRQRGHDVEVHQGALRGWRSAWLRLPQARLSVVVLINDMGDPGHIAADIAAHVLGSPPATVPRADYGETEAYFSPSLGLVLETRRAADAVQVACGGRTDELRSGPGTAGNAFFTADGEVSLVWNRGIPVVAYLHDNVTVDDCEPGAAAADGEAIRGEYRSAPLQASFIVEPAGEHACSIRFAGPLGRSDATPLEPVAESVWVFRCERALDHHPPGTFTVVFDTNAGSATLGCWIARHARFDRVSSQ